MCVHMYVLYMCVHMYVGVCAHQCMYELNPGSFSALHVYVRLGVTT